jgi:hypothetical protein
MNSLFNHTKGHLVNLPHCAMFISVASMEGMSHHVFEAFLENGVNWTRRPINAFCLENRMQTNLFIK